MHARKKAVIAAGLVVFVPALVFLAYGYVYVHLKYRYLIRQVESAQTASEEREAFRMAVDWGRVWEVDRLQPGDPIVQERKLSGDWLLRLEWLHSSPYGGGAYSAYRGVLDTNNLRILWEKKY